MIFKRLARALGVGGPTVETVLHETDVTPGDALTGEIRIVGGDHDVSVQTVAVSLVTRGEVEYEDFEGEDQEIDTSLVFHRVELTGPFELAAEEERVFTFEIGLPWELPVTELDGDALAGMTVGVRTDLEIAGALDKGDLDPVSVRPLPSQQVVLDAFSALGFSVKGADVESAVLFEDQALPFYQEIEFLTPPEYAGAVSSVELTFVATETDLTVAIGGGDAADGYRLPHDEVVDEDWETVLTDWLDGHAD
ncbi:sporulation protein [Actinocorallia sp. A-T 12471]|uniref:sporulation protein n=1 Tax=Actinocorallia sp. A-T 12471 TaxID=3089813 RepID=UPI0029D03D8B|nr:sporulation protein [Actinocorallia sp. A-T 12471]MDX6740868.1 sporulation protein [Actinocorallia sp. A-T 12471]